MQHFDLISAIPPILWTSKPDANTWNVLDRSGFYNCEMDRLAKERWKRLQYEDLNQTDRINGESWPLYIAGRKISQNFLAALEDHMNGSKAIQYWSDKINNFGEGSIDDVEISATGDENYKTNVLSAVRKNMLWRKEWMCGHTRNVHDASIQ